MTRPAIAILFICLPAAAQDAAWMQAQIDADIAAKRPPTLRLEARPYHVERPVSFRGWREGARLLGDGMGTRVICRFPSQFVNHPMFDFTGCTRAQVRDLVIQGGPPTNPKNRYEPAAGLLFARNTNNASSGWHTIERVYLRDRFRLACVAVIASEGNKFRDCEFHNHEGASKDHEGVPHGGHLLWFSNSDTGWFGTPLGGSTMQTAWVDSCFFAKTPVNSDDMPTSSVMVYSQAGAVISDLHFDNINSYSRDQLATILFHMPDKGSGGQTYNITISNGRFEEGTTENFVLCRGGRAIELFGALDSMIVIGDTAFDFGKRASTVSLERLRLVRRQGQTDEPAVKVERNTDAIKVRNVWNYEPIGWKKLVGEPR